MNAYRAFFAIFGIACCVLIGMLVLTPSPSKKPASTAAAAPAPAATQTPPVVQVPPTTHRAPEEIVVVLKKNGAMEINRTPVTMAQLQQKLTVLGDSKSKAVLLRYEKDAPFQSIRGILDACHAAQLTNIAFVNIRPGNGSGQE